MHWTQWCKTDIGQLLLDPIIVKCQTGNVAVFEDLRHKFLGAHDAETRRQHAIKRRRLTALNHHTPTTRKTYIDLLSLQVK